ncbi:MAG TPA: hypothetical protein VIG33_03085 [Pseudobdellovibrionaceae bacterium]|jgi:hypothetical protein
MKSLFFALVILSVTMSVGNAQTDSEERTEKEFYSLIENYLHSCSGHCQAPFQSKMAFNIRQPERSILSEEVKSNLKRVASSQAQIWGDTILEGDYYSAGHTQLDSVLVLFKNEILIGYKITYSERAWFIGDCDFDSNDEETLKNCNEGHIHESTFVSPDFNTFFSEDFADFAN